MKKEALQVIKRVFFFFIFFFFGYDNSADIGLIGLAVMVSFLLMLFISKANNKLIFFNLTGSKPHS
jgi:hypothetical protein